MPSGIGVLDQTHQDKDISPYRGTATLPIVSQLAISIEQEERGRLCAWAKHLWTTIRRSTIRHS